MQRPGGPCTTTPAFPCLTFASALTEVAAEFKILDVFPSLTERKSHRIVSWIAVSEWKYKVFCKIKSNWEWCEENFNLSWTKTRHISHILFNIYDYFSVLPLPLVLLGVTSVCLNRALTLIVVIYIHHLMTCLKCLGHHVQLASARMFLFVDCMCGMFIFVFK